MYRGATSIDASSEGLLLCQQRCPQSAPAPCRLNASGGQRGKGGLQGRAGHCTLFYRAMQRKDRQRDRDRERGGNCGGRVTASVASQCPRQEEGELCAADCLTETLAAGWWHFMVTTCNPTNSLAGENPVFKHWMALDSCCCYSRTKNDTLLHLFKFFTEPWAGVCTIWRDYILFASRIGCESKSKICSIMNKSIT